jgi:hypothetical protein
MNIINININNTPVNRIVYRNIHVNNAVTTIHRDAFVTGRSINGAIKENLFLREKRVMGAPDIRPERSTRMPVIKNIVQSNRPPQQIVNRVSDERERNSRFRQNQIQRNLPAGPTGSMARTGQTIDRKITAPQSLQNAPALKNVPARVEQAPAVRNPNVITGPQESREERTTRRLGELRSNTPPQNNIKGTGPQQAAPVRSATAPERKIEVPDRKIEVQGKPPQISVNEKPARTNTIQPQTPKPSDDVRSMPPLRSNSQAVAIKAPPQKNEEKPIVRDIKALEPREVRGPATLNNARENIPPRNIIKEAVPQQAAPIRATVVPERKVEIPERKIEVLKKIPEASANEQKVKAETRQQQNPKPMENPKIVPPVKSNSHVAISQPKPPPENTEKTQATPKGEQIIKQKENVKPEDNTKDLKKEPRTEMQQRKR